MKVLKLHKNIIAITGTLALATSTLLISDPSYAKPTSSTEAELNTAKQEETSTAQKIKKAEEDLLAAHDKLAAAFGESMDANNTYSEALVLADYKNEEHNQALEKLQKSQEKLGVAKEGAKKVAINNYKNMGGANSAPLNFISLDPEALSNNALSQAVENRNNQHMQSALQASNAAKNLAENAEATKKAADDAESKADSAKSDAESAQKSQEKLIRTVEQEREELIKTLARLKNSTVEIEKRHVEELEEQKERQYLSDLEAQTPQQPAAPALQSPSLPRPPEVAPSQPPLPEVTPPSRPNPPAIGGYQEIVISYMRARLGFPYVWGGTGPTGYDCSGLTLAAFASAGISLPRVAHAQFMAAPVKVPLAQMQPGDLLVWGPPSYFTHIGVYLGDGQVIHAFNPIDGVTITPLSWMGHMGLYPQAARF